MMHAYYWSSSSDKYCGAWWHHTTGDGYVCEFDVSPGLVEYWSFPVDKHGGRWFKRKTVKDDVSRYKVFSNIRVRR